MWSSWNMLRWGTYKHSWYAASIKCAGIIRKRKKKREIYGTIWALIFCIPSKHDEWWYVCLVLKLIPISVLRVPQWCLFLCVSTMLTAYFPIFTHFWLFVPCTSKWGKISSSECCISDFRIELFTRFQCGKNLPMFWIIFFLHTFCSKMVARFWTLSYASFTKWSPFSLK